MQQPTKKPTRAPQQFFESSGLFMNARTPVSLRPGKLVLTSRNIFFIESHGPAQFDLPLHTILRISVHKRRSMLKFKTRGGDYHVHLGSDEAWMWAITYVGLLMGILPGVLIYFILVQPNQYNGRKSVKLWQAAFAKHAIRAV